jgi:hypothetical protein
MKKYLVVLLLLFIPALTMYGENPKALLTYFDDVREIEVYDFTGKEVSSVHMGYPLLIGYGIQTRNSTAELQLKPNGTIVKLRENSFMKIEEMQGTENAKSNRFALMKGLFRMVASRLFNANYAIKTPSTVLGVRGTDFSVSVTSGTDSNILVQEGKVEVYNPATRETVLLEQGDGAGIRRRVVQKIDMEMEEVRKRIAMFDFKTLAPESVPREVPEDYDIEFDYFSEIEYEEFQKFFADENYFDDSEKYLEQFKEYYRDEMADFHDRFEEEQQSFEAFKYRQLEEYYKYRQ